MRDSWPPSDLENVSACPACGSARRALLHSNLTDRVFRCAPGEWTLYRCGHCGSAYLDPRPTPQSIGRAYSRYYTHEPGALGIAGRPSWPRRFVASAANAYYNRQFGTRLTPTSRLGLLLTMLMSAYRQRLDGRARHLPRARAGSRLLDVGCGNGDFLRFAQSAGWDVSGIEPDPTARAQCARTGLAVTDVGIEDYPESGGLFDLITVSHVIEHVHRPHDLLRHCHRLVKPGGAIWIETPNVDSQGHRRYGDAWRGLEPPRHLVVFSRAALASALAEAGFLRIADAPYRPMCRDIFKKSEALILGADPYRVRQRWLDRMRYVAAERAARRSPEIREFVTLVGVKAT